MRRLCVISLMPLLVSGCSTHLFVTLFNNAASVVTVSGSGEGHQIAPGTAATFRLVRDIALEVEGKKWRYANPEVPGEYYANHKLLWHRIRVQLQPGGELLLLKGKELYPVESETHQPAGFPLRPMSTEQGR